MTKYQVQIVHSQILFLVILVLLADSLGSRNCPASSCGLSGIATEYCYCDHFCQLYGDCCHDANVTTDKTVLDSRFSCVDSGFGSGGSTFWMVTSCSRLWITDQLADGVANVNEIVSLCEDLTVTNASYKFVPPPVSDGSTGFVYRNEFCARCNGLQQSKQISWSIQLDCRNNESAHHEEEACPSGSVFDAFRGSCRTLPSANCTNSTAITLARGSYSLTSNESVFWHSYNLNVSIESVNDNGRPLVCIPCLQCTNCAPIILESSEYIQQGNDSGTFNLLWLSDNETYSIEGTDKNGRPLICANFTQNFTRNSTQVVTVFSYPVAFHILSFIGLSLDFVSCLSFLLTFLLFKDLRTFFSKLMVNFVLSILLGDILFLVGAPLFQYVRVDILCSILAVAIHYVYLCRFSWMTVMGSELVRSVYNIKKLNKSAAENWKLLTLYMLLAWLSPLVIVIPTIIVNFTVEDSVNYGVGSSCWINQPIALIVTFVVPVGLSVIFNVIAFVVVMVILAHIRHKPMTSSRDPKERKKQSWKDFRFAVALMTVTGLSWLFGFLALFSNDLSWAWYLFIIFNTTQAVTVLVAFLFTKKVFHLYWSLLCCSRAKPSKTVTSKLSTTSTKV